MSKDPYANYVVKTAMEVLDEGKERDQLYAVLLSHQAELVSSIPFYTVNTSKRDLTSVPFSQKSRFSVKRRRPLLRNTLLQ